MWGPCHAAWGAGFAFGPGMLLWAVLVGLAVWAIVRQRPAPAAAGVPTGEAREIARRRYAKGEITKDEFTQLMKDLD